MCVTPYASDDCVNLCANTLPWPLMSPNEPFSVDYFVVTGPPEKKTTTREIREKFIVLMNKFYLTPARTHDKTH